MFCGERSRGSALVEFAISGVIFIFVCISIEEGARGFYTYDTLQYAAKTAGAYAAVHGATCAVSPNACTVTVSNIASVFQTAAVGVLTNQVTLTFTTASGATTNCNLGGGSNLCSGM